MAPTSAQVLSWIFPLQSQVPAPIHTLFPLCHELWEFSSSYLSAELWPKKDIIQPQLSKMETQKYSTEQLISYQNCVIYLQYQHTWCAEFLINCRNSPIPFCNLGSTWKKSFTSGAILDVALYRCYPEISEILAFVTER